MAQVSIQADRDGGTGWSYIPSQSAGASRSCSSTSSPATIAPGSRKMRRFSRSHRCITYGARGYPPVGGPRQIPLRIPSSTPSMTPSPYWTLTQSGRRTSSGSPWGASPDCTSPWQHPGRVRSLVAAGTGYGARPGEVERFRGECDAIAEVIETAGIVAFARQYMSGPSRVQLQNKDRRAWQEYTDWLGEHSAEGSAATMRGVQRGRPSLYALEAELAAIAAPVLVLAGDEDDGCLDTSVWLKRVIPTAGLAVLPKSGHTLNIEEPDLVNTLIADFLSQVSRRRLGAAGPASRPGSHHRLLVTALAVSGCRRPTLVQRAPHVVAQVALGQTDRYQRGHSRRRSPLISEEPVNGEHHEVIPRHNPIKAKTLSSILKSSGWSLTGWRAGLFLSGVRRH